jgi:hypothetical protein
MTVKGTGRGTNILSGPTSQLGSNEKSKEPENNVVGGPVTANFGCIRTGTAMIVDPVR